MTVHLFGKQSILLHNNNTLRVSINCCKILTSSRLLPPFHILTHSFTRIHYQTWIVVHSNGLQPLIDINLVIIGKQVYSNAQRINTYNLLDLLLPHLLHHSPIQTLLHVKFDIMGETTANWSIPFLASKVFLNPTNPTTLEHLQKIYALQLHLVTILKHLDMFPYWVMFLWGNWHQPRRVDCNKLHACQVEVAGAYFSVLFQCLSLQHSVSANQEPLVSPLKQCRGNNFLSIINKN